MGDYPELFEKLKKDEFGYVKGMLSHIFCFDYNEITEVQSGTASAFYAFHMVDLDI